MIRYNIMIQWVSPHHYHGEATSATRNLYLYNKIHESHSLSPYIFHQLNTLVIQGTFSYTHTQFLKRFVITILFVTTLTY